MKYYWSVKYRLLWHLSRIRSVIVPECTIIPRTTQISWSFPFHFLIVTNLLNSIFFPIRLYYTAVEYINISSALFLTFDLCYVSSFKYISIASIRSLAEMCLYFEY